jgi:two-component system CheB/CheR fusion protein
MASDSSMTHAGLGTFPVVGIGASAGGVEALTAFLHAVEFDSMAFVVVQHRSAHHESRLAELLARATRLKVSEIADGVRVEPNQVYVAPAGAHVAILGRVLHLVQSNSRLPIDFLFRSLAGELGEQAVGIVLSGTGSDGTFGLQAIKEHGGICLVQSPETAKFDAMPRSAVDRRVADTALAPDALARELASITRHPYLRPGPRPKLAGLHKFYGLLRETFGHDLSGYKENTIERRVERRMAVQKIEKIEEYFRLVQTHPDELATLYRDLLINVTNFFREPATFSFLETAVLPRLVSNRRAAEPIRVWVPACSTGEEAYSIAICLLEALGERASEVPVQLFGTDIDVEAIDRARRGFYPPNIETDVSVGRLGRFFVKAEGGYQISRRVRDLVVFSVQDVADDAPFSRMDLVSCRNMLIYMQAPLQKRVLATLHYALRPDGFLFLGSSESVADGSDLFAVVDRKTKVYEKKANATVAQHHASERRVSGVISVAAPERPMNRVPATTSAQALADVRLLEKYAPPSVLVTADLDVLLFRGDTAAYVSPASGEATLNVMRLIRPELHPELWRAFETARKGDAPVRLPPVRFEGRIGGKIAAHNTSIEIVPLRPAESQDRFMLVIFHEVRDGSTASAEPVAPPSPLAEDDRMKALEQELTATREFLQSTIEELESSNEELQSTNEELQSANEELQSTNEELEASKEELQSTNEELSTVNDEFQRRLADLARRDSDLTNVLRSVRDPILFVDGGGHLRHFSYAAADLLDLAPGDVGRPVDFLRSRLGGIPLDRIVARSVERLSPITEDLMAFNSRWYALTARPYATAQGSLDGALVTMVDIDTDKRTAELTINVSAYAERMLPAILHPLVMLDEKNRVAWANASFFSTFRVDAAKTVGNLFHNLGTGQWAHPRLREHIGMVFRSGEAFQGFLVEHDFEGLGARRMMVSGSRIQGVDRGGSVALLSIVDVSSPRGV